MLTLGIETSCDETALALYDTKRGLIGDVLYSQIELHAKFGGVVPELASRDHLAKIAPLFNALLEQTGIAKVALDAVAYTRGPGLIGALMTGALFGRALAYALDIRALGIHHMEGHLLSPLLAKDAPRFPFVCLLVSGGHTLLVLARALGDYVILGQSIDDAAGECFDKTAKMLSLPYPGGAHIAKLAQGGDPNRFDLPRPMLHRGLDFSFSGMKTAVHNLIKDTLPTSTDPDQARRDLAASFEHAMCDTLAKKAIRALKETGVRRLVVAGGVSANVSLRQMLNARTAALNARVYYPDANLCTDNGAMIAFAGAKRLEAGFFDDLSVACLPRWSLESLDCVSTQASLHLAH